MATSRTGTTRYLNARRKLRGQRNDCHICLQPIDYSLPANHPESFEADHLVPFSRGGTDSFHNLRASHRSCNRSKGVGDVSPAQNNRHIREW